MDAQLLLHVGHNAGINVAAAGAHQHAGQRGQAHAGIHALAAVHSGDGGTVAQVAGDHLQLAGVLAQELGSGHAHIAVAGAVSAVAADGVLLVHLVGHAVDVSLGRHGLMEGGVEYNHVGSLSTEHSLGAAQALHMSHVVNGSQGSDLLDLVDDGIGHDLALGEELSTLHNAVADGADLALILHNSALAGGHHLNDLGESLGVGGEGNLFGPGAAVGLMGDLAALDADALAQALAQHVLIVHVDELVLQRRRTAVDNQNLHVLVSSCNHVKSKNRRKNPRPGKRRPLTEPGFYILLFLLYNGTNSFSRSRPVFRQ